MREIGYAFRRLRGSPMFTIAATLTLAIAIGATASVFGIVDGVLLKSFPYRDPDRVLTIWQSNAERHQLQVGMAPANYFDYQAQNTAFTALAASGNEFPFMVTRAHDAESVSGVAVTPSYFAVLGITPVLGRPLAADSNGPPEVIISYGYWQQRFGGAPSVIGQTLNLDNPSDPSPTPRHRYTIVGVMPPGLPGAAELWTRTIFDPDNATMRDVHYLLVYGRLRPGVSTESGQSDLETIAGRLAAAYPQANAHWSVRTVSARGPAAWAREACTGDAALSRRLCAPDRCGQPGQPVPRPVLGTPARDGPAHSAWRDARSPHMLIWSLKLRSSA